MAAGATVELHQGLALGLELRIVHEVGRIVLGVGMLQGHQIAGHVARVLDAEPQARHHGRLLHDELVPIVGTARVVQIENERQVVLGVIFRS